MAQRLSRAAADAYIDGPVEAELAAHWAAVFAGDEPRRVILVAAGADGIAGFVAAWPETGETALIDNLHVAPGRRGGGVGRRLLGRAAVDLRQRGLSRRLPVGDRAQ